MANPHIINFIKSLNPVETRIVEEHLNKTQALFGDSEAMEIKLFKYIINHRKDNITDEIIIAQT
jgi:hypothetical protein